MLQLLLLMVKLQKLHNLKDTKTKMKTNMMWVWVKLLRRKTNSELVVCLGEVIPSNINKMINFYFPEWEIENCLYCSAEDTPIELWSSFWG
jgi:hypothetical protein